MEDGDEELLLDYRGVAIDLNQGGQHVVAIAFDARTAIDYLTALFLDLF